MKAGWVPRSLSQGGASCELALRRYRESRGMQEVVSYNNVPFDELLCVTSPNTVAALIPWIGFNTHKRRVLQRRTSSSSERTALPLRKLRSI
jgi:hypothetical protein